MGRVAGLHNEDAGLEELVRIGHALVPWDEFEPCDGRDGLGAASCRRVMLALRARSSKHGGAGRPRWEEGPPLVVATCCSGAALTFHPETQLPELSQITLSPGVG